MLLHYDIPGNFMGQHDEALHIKASKVADMQAIQIGLDNATQEEVQTEIIDYTVCRRCSVQYCDKRRCRKARR